MCRASADIDCRLPYMTCRMNNSLNGTRSIGRSPISRRESIEQGWPHSCTYVELAGARGTVIWGGPFRLCRPFGTMTILRVPKQLDTKTVSYFITNIRYKEPRTAQHDNSCWTPGSRVVISISTTRTNGFRDVPLFGKERSGVTDSTI